MLIEATYGNAGASYPAYGSSASQAAERSEAARRARPETAPLPAPAVQPEPRVTEVTQAARSETSNGTAERLPGLVARSEVALAAAVEDRTPLIEFREAVAADGIPESFPRERPPVKREEEATPTDEQAEALEAEAEAEATLPAEAARDPGAPAAPRVEAAAEPEAAAQPAAVEASSEPSRAEQRIRQAEELTQQVSIVNGQRPASVLDILR